MSKFGYLVNVYISDFPPIVLAVEAPLAVMAEELAMQRYTNAKQAVAVQSIPILVG